MDNVVDWDEQLALTLGDALRDAQEAGGRGEWSGGGEGDGVVAETAEWTLSVATVGGGVRQLRFGVHSGDPVLDARRLVGVVRAIRIVTASGGPAGGVLPEPRR